MGLPVLDQPLLFKFLLPAFIVVALIVYLFIREILLFFWRARRRTQVQKKVSKQRQGPKTAQAASMALRRSDHFDQLTPAQKKIHARAKALEERGQYLEAARLYEVIHFHRRTIDILESHGYIDQACAILLRMGAPNRAAVIYERNGWHTHAAECFLRDYKPELAGQAFEKSATKDFNFYRRAAECYLQAGLIDNALRALSRLVASADILRLALEKQCYEFLQQYLDLPFHAQELLPELSVEQFRQLVNELQPTPQGAERLAHWTKSRPDEIVVGAALPRFVPNKTLLMAFWKHLDEHFIDHISGLLERAPMLVQRDTLELHADALRALNRDMLADRLLGKPSKPGSGSPPPMVIGL